MSEILNNPINSFEDFDFKSQEAINLRNIILDSSIDIPPSGRSNVENMEKWDKDTVVSYGRWLCQLLELSPPANPPLRQADIRRASKLGLGPSTTIINRVVGGVRDLQSELGFRNSSPFRFWSRDDFIEAGVSLARKIDGRPGQEEMKNAFHQGDFPYPKEVVKRFGSLRTFQELIGYPRAKGWKIDDYIDWGVAFRRQNGLGAPLTKRVIGILAKRGVGPGEGNIQQYFQGINNYRNQVDEAYQQSIIDEELTKTHKLKEGLEMAKKDAVLQEALTDLDDDGKLRVISQYKLIVELCPQIKDKTSTLKVLLSRYTTEGITKWLVENFYASSLGDVEATAVELNIFDDLWPMYRFQNVDLSYT